MSSAVRNNLLDRIFQIGLVLAIPTVSYIYAQGVKETTVTALNKTITELNLAVKELSGTTNQLSNNTTILTAQAQRNEKRLDNLEEKVDQNRIDILSMKGRK